jgi:hypothetical protein
VLQLPASNSNNSQGLARSSPLTHSLTHSLTNQLALLYCTALNQKPKSKLCYDRRSVGQCVWVSSTHLGAKTRFLLLSNSFGVPSLTRGRVCRLQLLLVLASAVILGSESRETHDNILLSQIRDPPPTWRARFPYLYLQGQGSPVTPPGIGFPFRRLLRLAGLCGVGWHKIISVGRVI